MGIFRTSYQTALLDSRVIQNVWIDGAHFCIDGNDDYGYSS